MTVRRKVSTAKKRASAATRQAEKRQRDKERRAPSMAQITTALGHAARVVISEARAQAPGGRGQLQGPLARIVRDAVERLPLGWPQHRGGDCVTHGNSDGPEHPHYFIISYRKYHRVNRICAARHGFRRSNHTSAIQAV